ncbi:Scarecrow-like protein 15 [Acorus calamus]|uniref:Scarecrow-like protein 15 n=1 Tax=Acorus calamus TaxID=4465 RepID=A0AAV9FFT6_ACOCL|nr:Scarecrow-like protein 15 [Acorus calamus]
MKSVLTSFHTHHQFPLSKPTTTIPSSPSSTAAATAFYEPTSVLDPLFTGGSGGGLPTGPSSSSDYDDLLHRCDSNNNNNNNNTHPSPPLLSDDWDSVMWLLTEKDDPAPPLPSNFPPDPPPLYPPSSPDHHHHPVDQLIRAVEAVESNNLPLALSILARLNQTLPVPTGRPPLQRSVFYFKDALQSLLDPRRRHHLHHHIVSAVQTIGALKSYSDLSPAHQFATLTANQAMLESLDPTSHSVRLIDFDLGLGGHWASYLQEVHTRCRSSRSSPPSITIIAVEDEEEEERSLETALAAENLLDFARGLGICLSVQFVRVDSLSPSSIRPYPVEPVAVSLSPAVFRRLGSSPESAAGLLRLVRAASPRIVVFVDYECRRSGGGGGGGSSFKRDFLDAVEMYATVMESLDAVEATTASAAEQVRMIEKWVIRPRVAAAVSAAAAGGRMGGMTWREVMEGSGASAVRFSEFAESLAECVASRGPARGFHVARRDSSLSLCWQGREIVSTSAWRW